MAMSVAETQHVAENRDGCGAAGIGETFFEPVIRAFESLHEEVAKHGVEMIGNVAKDFDALFYRFGLDVGNAFATSCRFHVY